MKIKLLTTSTPLKEIILKNLDEVNLTAEVIEYNQPLYPQFKDVEILVNSSAKVDRSYNRCCAKPKNDTSVWNRH